METLLRLQGLPQSLMALLTLTMEIRVTTSSSNASEGKRKASRQLSSAGKFQCRGHSHTPSLVSLLKPMRLWRRARNRRRLRHEPPGLEL